MDERHIETVYKRPSRKTSPILLSIASCLADTSHLFFSRLHLLYHNNTAHRRAVSCQQDLRMVLFNDAKVAAVNDGQTESDDAVMATSDDDDASIATYQLMPQTEHMAAPAWPHLFLSSHESTYVMIQRQEK
jgi:hypothetical protein